MVAYQVFGIAGTVIYLIIFLTALWQCILQFCPYVPPIYTIKKTVFLLLLLYCGLQALSLINYCQGRFYDKWQFTCLLFGLCAEIFAVSLVAILWSKHLVSLHNANSRVIPFLLSADFCYLGYTLAIAVEVNQQDVSLTTFLKTSNLYRYMLLVEPITLLFNAYCLVYLGYTIRNRLVNHPSWEPFSKEQKKMILFNLLITVVIIAGCFSARSGVELYLYSTTHESFQASAWWVSVMGMPSLLPASVLIYNLRRTRASMARGGNGMDSLEGDEEEDAIKQWRHSNERDCCFALANCFADCMINSTENSHSRSTSEGHGGSGGSTGGVGLGKKRHSSDLALSFDHVIAPLLANHMGNDIEEEHQDSESHLVRLASSNLKEKPLNIAPSGLSDPSSQLIRKNSVGSEYSDV